MAPQGPEDLSILDRQSFKIQKHCKTVSFEIFSNTIWIILGSILPFRARPFFLLQKWCQMTYFALNKNTETSFTANHIGKLLNTDCILKGGTNLQRIFFWGQYVVLGLLGSNIKQNTTYESYRPVTHTKGKQHWKKSSTNIFN